MDRQALIELRDQVKAGTLPMGYNADRLDCGALSARWSDVEKAFDGSLDAAKALHEAVLPGWEWRLRDNRAWVWTGVLVYGGEEVETAEFCGLPARAWLLAILDALIAKEASDG